MNFAALRSVQSKLSIAFVTTATLLLGSCGGGGSAQSPLTTGELQILPATGSFYAGVPYTIAIAGGRKPYLVVSDDFTLLPLNFTLNANQFSFVANNPGVVDVGLEANEVPRRTVNVTVRDSANQFRLAIYNVLQNFFTGYGEFYTTTCPAGGTVAPQACSGQDSIVTLVPVSQGTLYGNRTLRFDKIRGDFQWVQEPPATTPQLVNSISLTTDHEGKVILRLRVPVGAPTQLATYRITDIATGTSTDVVFVITQVLPVETITLLPSAVTFTAGLSNQCGSGQATIFVFDGAPPYTITTSPPVIVFPSVVLNSGDSFQVAVPSNLQQCPSQQVIVTDSRGARAILQVDSSPGSTDPPDILVSPDPIAGLACGASQTAGIVGGAGPLSAISSQQFVTAIISGNLITVTRAPTGTLSGVPPANTAAIITITDGNSLYTLDVTGIATVCP